MIICLSEAALLKLLTIRLSGRVKLGLDQPPSRLAALESE
jgi:hypothetical protein